MVFKIYRHTTLPPPIKGSSLPWPFASIFGTLGLTAGPTQPATPIITGGVAESNPTQPPIPRRVAYYTAAFEKSTTLGKVDMFESVTVGLCECEGGSEGGSVSGSVSGSVRV